MQRQRITKPENIIIIPTPDETTRESAAVAMEQDADERDTVKLLAEDAAIACRCNICGCDLDGKGGKCSNGDCLRNQ